MQLSQDEVLSQIIKEQKLKQSEEYKYLEGISQVRQDRAASALGLSRETNLSPNLIYDNPSLQPQNLISPRDFEQLGFSNPQVKQFLDDPIHMGIVRDKSNIKLLQEVDNNFRTWAAAKNGFKAMFTKASSYFDMIGRERNKNLIDELEYSGFYENEPLKKQELEEKIREMASKPTVWNNITTNENLQREEIKTNSKIEEYYFTVVEQAPQFAAQIISAALGGAPATATFMFTQIAGGTYNDLQAQGVGHERASTGAFSNAVSQAPLESLPIYKLFKPGTPFFKVGGATTSRLVESTLTESLTEFIQQYPEAAVNLWARTEGMDWEQRAKIFATNLGETTQDALYAGAVAAPFGFLGGAGRVYFERSAERQIHQESMKVIEQDAEAIRKSELLKKSPEVIERFGNSQGEVIYVDAESALKLYQSGKENILKELNVAEEDLIEAAAKGEMLEVQKGTYEVAIAKDATLHEELKNDIAFEAKGLTNNKIEYLNNKDVQKATQEVVQEKKDLAKEKATIYKEIRSTGIQTEVARNALTALTSHAQVMADYEGITASQWLKDNAPRFVKQMDNIVYTQIDRRIEQESENFAKQLEDWQQGNLDRRNPLNVGRTPSILQKLGAKDLPLEISQKVIDKIVRSGDEKGGKHDLGIDILKQLPKQLNEPVMVFKSRTRPDSMVALTELFDENNKGIIVAVHMDVQHKTRMVNAVASMYGRTDVKNFVKNQVPVYMNKKKSRDWLHSGQLQLLPRVAQSDSTNIITEDGDIYNQENRGAITWDKEGKAVIGFFQNADPSTVVHELTGHYFTENLRRVATKENAPQQAVKDWQTLLEDANLKDWETATKDEKTAAQERWAQMAESYILNGKAPSLELKSVFAKFKNWLTEVYKTLKQTQIEVPQQVAEVFDRLLASQQAIDELATIEGYYSRLPVDLIDSLSDAGKRELDRKLLNAKATAEELTTKSLMNFIKADTQETIKQEREKATAKFTEELSKTPFYETVAVVEDTFKEQYKTAKGLAKAYQNKSETLFKGEEDKGKFSDELMVQFEEAAMLNGYNSGSELAQKILGNPTLQQEVEQQVNLYIEQKFPDYMKYPEALKAEARQNIYNDDSALLVATEQTIIQEQLTKTLNADERKQLARFVNIEVKQLAQAEIERLSIKDATSLQKYITAERNAAVKADRALRAKDYENASVYKTQQLYNHSLVMESLKVKRRFEQTTKYLKRQAKSKIKGWNKEVNFVQAADILQKIGFPHSKYNPLLKQETLEGYWNRNKIENLDIVNIPEWLGIGLYEGTNARDLTISEYEDIANAIKNIRQIDKIGVDSDSFSVIDNGGSANEKVQELLKTASNLKDVLIDEAGVPRAKGALLSGLREVYIGNKKITQILLELDNMQDFGVWHDTFYRSVKEAADQKSFLMREVGIKVDEAFKAEGIDFAQRYRDTNNKFYIKEWDVSLSKQDLRTLVLNMGSESNLRVLTGKMPVGFNQNEQWYKENWTEEQIKTVVMRYLNEKDLRIIDKTWQAIDLFYEPYNKMVTKMTGFSLPKVEARPIEFTLSDGTIHRSQGGYFPLKQDRRATKQTEMNAEKMLDDYVGVLPYPNTGASKARTGASYSIDLDFNNVFNHIEQVSHDIAFRPVMHDLNKLMRKDEIREVLRRKLGEEGYRAIVDWQGAVARGKDTIAVKDGMDKIVSWIRSRTVTASLLLRPGVIMQNNANFLLYGNSVQGFTEQDAINSYLKRGMGDFIPNALGSTQRAKALREFVYSKSVMMRDKMDAPDFSLRELQGMVKEGNVLTRSFDGIAQTTGLKIELTRNQLNKLGTELMAWSDQLTDIPMWLGAYEKALELGKNEKDAAHFADTVIERSTGSGRLIDTSKIQRGGQWQRTMTMFTGFFNTQLNRWIREGKIFMETKDMGRMFVFATKQYIGFGVLSALLSFKFPDMEDPWEWLIKDVLAWPLGMVPFFGPAVKSGLESMLGFQTFGYSMSPVTSQISGVLRAGKTLINEDATNTEKIEALAASGAFLLGYPDQINDWLFNLYDITMNDMPPELMDAVKRRPKRDR